MTQPFKLPPGLDPRVIRSLITYVTNGRDQLSADAQEFEGTQAAYILSETAHGLDRYKRLLESYDFEKGIQ